MDNSVMVIKKEILLKNYFEGFNKQGDYKSLILNNYEFMNRSLAEINFDYKQPISYGLVINPAANKVFLYKRKGNEKRLRDKFSIGIGGHINKKDLGGNPLINSLMRELKEELIIKDLKIKNLGYINDDSTEVGRVHFGIVYVVETLSDVKPLGDEFEEGYFVDINELKNLKNLEEWSKLCINPLIELFRP